MKDLIRDTAFGFVVRTLSGGRFLAYPEGKDPRTVEINMSTASTLHQHLSHSKRGLPPAGDDTGAETPPDPELEKKGDPENDRPEPYIIDWLENDPANPLNWSTGKKFFVTFEVCFLTTAVYIGSAIYTAGIAGPGGVMEIFEVSDVAALLGLTLFVCGYGLGPMLWSPMSEVPPIGRMPVYILTLLVFVGLQPAVIYAPNFGALLAFRFLTGFFGGPVLATGGATIGDVYRPTKRAYGIATWGISAVLGPVLGPLVGGFAAEAKGWTWTIWELMWLSGFCLIFLFFFLPETSASNILYRRTVRLRRQTGETKQTLKCEPELEAENMTTRELVMMVLVRPFTLSFTEPIILALNLYIALLYALIYLWFESFPLVFIDQYGFTLGEEGLAFIGILMGAVIVIPPFFWFLHKHTEPRFNENGDLVPEERLPPAMVGGFCIPVCLFWFAWSAGRTHWIVPIIGTVWFSVGATLLFNSVLNYFGDAYPRYAASVFAGNDLFRSGFAASFPLFANAMFHRLGIDWGNTLLGFLSALFIPIPFILYKYGRQLRMMSKNARHDI